MSYKVLNQGVAGTATKVGPNDWDLLTKTFNGVTNVANPVVDSNFTFKHGRCRFLNPANGKVVGIGTSFNTQDMLYYLPQPVDANDDTLVSNRSKATLENKTLDASTNTLLGFLKSPSAMKNGQIVCGVVLGGSTGSGLLNGFIDMPKTMTTTDRGTDSTYGNYWRYGLTNTTANTALGIRMPATYMRKELDCRIRVKYRLSTSPTNARVYIGFSTDATLPVDDTPLPSNESGCLIGLRTSDSTIKVFRNAGTNSAATTASVSDTGVARGNAGDVRTVDITFMTSATTGNKVAWTRVWTGTNTNPTHNVTYDTNMPFTNQSMSPSVQASWNNTSENQFDIFYVEVEQR